jgi:hypothetical protein
MNGSGKRQLVGLITVLLALATPVFAGTSATLSVGATIKPWMKFTSTQHVATYQVSSEDLKKGYVDLANVITVNLSTNNSAGVRVLVGNGDGGEVLLKESGTAAEFATSSFTMTPSGYRAGTLISKRYDSRIPLPSDARVGTYPLTLTLMPAI